MEKEKFFITVYMWDTTTGILLQTDPIALIYGLEEGDTIEYTPLPDLYELNSGLYQLECVEVDNSDANFEVVSAVCYSLEPLMSVKSATDK